MSWSAHGLVSKWGVTVYPQNGHSMGKIMLNIDKPIFRQTHVSGGLGTIGKLWPGDVGEPWHDRCSRGVSPQPGGSSFGPRFKNLSKPWPRAPWDAMSICSETLKLQEICFGLQVGGKAMDRICHRFPMGFPWGCPWGCPTSMHLGPEVGADCGATEVAAPQSGRSSATDGTSAWKSRWKSRWNPVIWWSFVAESKRFDEVHSIHSHIHVEGSFQTMSKSSVGCWYTRLQPGVEATSSEQNRRAAEVGKGWTWSNSFPNRLRVQQHVLKIHCVSAINRSLGERMKGSPELPPRLILGFQFHSPIQRADPWSSFLCCAVLLLAPAAWSLLKFHLCAMLQFREQWFWECTTTGCLNAATKQGFP